MPKKLITTEIYAKRVKNLTHGEYELVSEYINSNSNITLKHKKCGNVYTVKVHTFATGRRCPKCQNQANKGIDKFKKEMNEIYGREYTVIGKYVNARTKILLRHNVCGNTIEVTPCAILKKRICKFCNGGVEINHDEFIERFSKRNDCSEYEILGKYIKSNRKIKVRHKKCDSVEYITPTALIQGQSCKKCVAEIRGINRRRKMALKFKEVFNILAENEYDLLSEYEYADRKVKIRHKICGNNYEVTPHKFIQGDRCPYCKNSKGEKQIQDICKKYKFKYKQQYKNKECKDKKELPFDFALLKNNNIVCLIEYDGEQHYKPIDYFGGIKAYEVRKKHDNIKDDYCTENKIPLIRIPYTIKDIETYLINKINQLELTF